MEEKAEKILGTTVSMIVALAVGWLIYKHPWAKAVSFTDITIPATEHIVSVVYKENKPLLLVQDTSKTFVLKYVTTDWRKNIHIETLLVIRPEIPSSPDVLVKPPAQK